MYTITRNVLVLFALVVGVHAQTNQITLPEGPLAPGHSVTLGFQYNGPTPVPESVEVQLSNGLGGVQTLSITLNGDGTGTVTWTVPAWPMVFANANGALEVSRLIL